MMGLLKTRGKLIREKFIHFVINKGKSDNLKFVKNIHDVSEIWTFSFGSNISHITEVALSVAPNVIAYKEYMSALGRIEKTQKDKVHPFSMFWGGKEKGLLGTQLMPDITNAYEIYRIVNEKIFSLEFIRYVIDNVPTSVLQNEILIYHLFLDTPKSINRFLKEIKEMNKIEIVSKFYDILLLNFVYAKEVFEMYGMLDELFIYLHLPTTNEARQKLDQKIYKEWERLKTFTPHNNEAFGKQLKKFVNKTRSFYAPVYDRNIVLAALLFGDEMHIEEPNEMPDVIYRKQGDVITIDLNTLEIPGIEKINELVKGEHLSFMEHEGNNMEKANTKADEDSRDEIGPTPYLSE